MKPLMGSLRAFFFMNNCIQFPMMFDFSGGVFTHSYLFSCYYEIILYSHEFAKKCMGSSMLPSFILYNVNSLHNYSALSNMCLTHICIYVCVC